MQFYLGENKFGLHQVAYDSFENPKEALTFLRRVKRTEISRCLVAIGEIALLSLKPVFTSISLRKIKILCARKLPANHVL